MQSLLRVQALVLSAAMISACGLSNSTKADTETPVLKGLSGLQGGDYSVGVLNTGMEVYTDRPYVVTKVPASLEGAQFIQTPNNHKKVRVNQALSFELQKKADVFVAYDRRAKTLPDWLSDWKRIDGEIATTDLTRHLYKKTFPAGAKVALGGNWHGKADGAESNYNVIVRPL